MLSILHIFCNLLHELYIYLSSVPDTCDLIIVFIIIIIIIYCYINFLILAYFPYFEKIKVGFCDNHAMCL
jgi:hypothetical protein